MSAVVEKRMANESLERSLPNVAPMSCRAPARPDGLIEREGLVKRLLDSASARTVVVCAAGGYGKTITIALWSESDDRPFAWVQLDELDNDPLHLLQHVALALDRIQPVDPVTARIVGSPGGSVATGPIPAMAQEFRRRDPFVLVFDDVHVLRSPAAVGVIDGLLAHLPTGVQLVLSGRSVSSLPLGRRRMMSELFELSSDDLSMTIDEATRLLERDGVTLDTDDLEHLYHETEGWPGGLHLASLAIAQSGPGSLVGERVSGRNRFIADFLMEEVLAGQPDETVDFLRRSSVLERMDAPLLDDLLGIDDAASRLQEIEQSGNLFLIPLDEDREWYRYHHLFAEMLRARLAATDPAAVVRLELRASAILETRADLDGAIRHALAGGNTERAVDLVLRDAHALAFSGHTSRLAQRLEFLDSKATTESTATALARCWLAIAIGDAELFARGLATVELDTGSDPLADGSPRPEVAAATLRAVAGAWGLEGVIRDTQIVRDAGRLGNPWWGLATCIQGAAYSLLGRDEDARRQLTEGLPIVTTPAFEAGAYAQLAWLDVRAGDLSSADRHAAYGLATVERNRLHSIMPSGAVFATGSLVAARLGRFDEARQHAVSTQRLLAQLGDLSPRMSLVCYSLLAQSALACSDLRLARAMATEAQRVRPLVADATFLHAQLDEVAERLEQGSASKALEAAPLTSAELRVLAYLPTHHSLQDIADQLYISRNTAKSHSVAIFRKLGASSRKDAVRVAREIGLLDV
jgi:LuxR family maltose regulon positive regulatory protein